MKLGRRQAGGVALAGATLLMLRARENQSSTTRRPIAPSSAVTVQIDAGQPVRRISPLIYGVAVAGRDDLAAVGARLHRWGGNPNSRYNWELGNAWNAARDWEFRNVSYGNDAPADRAPSGVADQWAAGNRATGVESLLTIPALGWVARDADNQTRSLGVPKTGGQPTNGPAGAIAGYDPSANRNATSVASFARKRAPFADPPDLADERVYQDEWVAHLVGRFGSAAEGGVRFYAIDNEPDLWSETHTDVHPAQTGYDDVLATFVEYAEAIKDVDATALVLGPCSWGWTGYFYSSRDRGADNFRTHTDRRAHGDRPFLPWWLDQIRRHDERGGRRTLDVLDVHYYPQAQHVFSGATDEATNALRLRSTRSLWDPGYVDESWIREPVRLIPRLREWIAQYYPGTQLAIGEWNWGAERTPNGALAIAEVLGIFGREGVDLAAYWTTPPRGSPGALAFTMFTNYDGAGSAFGDLALRATTIAGGGGGADDLAVFASQESASGDVVVIAINKRPDTVLPTTLSFVGFGPSNAARLYRYAGGDVQAIRDLGEVATGGQELSLAFPPSSITLLRLKQ